MIHKPLAAASLLAVAIALAGCGDDKKEAAATQAAAPAATSTAAAPAATAKVDEEAIGRAVEEVFDLRPAAIIRDLDLRKPIFERTAYHGHFGREGFPWEATSRTAPLQEAVAARVG